MVLTKFSLSANFELTINALADRPDCLVIDLPWIDATLLPNNRLGKHWAASESAKNRAKFDATIAQELGVNDRRFNPLLIYRGQKILGGKISIALLKV